MVYREFHLSSSANISPSSTRNHPIWELQDPLYVDRLALRYCELPLTFCNIGNGAGFTYQLTYVEVTENEPGKSVTYTYECEVAPGCYSGLTFMQAMKKALLEAAEDVDIEYPDGPPVTEPTDGPQIANVTFQISSDDGGRLLVTTPGVVHDIGNDGTAVWTFQAGAVLWYPGMLKYFNRPDNDPNPVLIWEFPEEKVLSLYPLKLIPNYVYLHCNLMAGTPYASQQRPLGGFATRTVLAKIPIDTDYVWREQVMPFENHNMDPMFMYECEGNEYSYIECWFTTEDGTELDFSNVAFSLTLSVMQRMP